MSCDFVFLNVGNGDSIAVLKQGAPAVFVDMPRPAVALRLMSNWQVRSIARIYFTHDHTDHFPSLLGLVTFLQGWCKHGTIGSVHLSHEIIPYALRRVRVLGENTLEGKRIRYAVERLLDLERQKLVVLTSVDSGCEPYVNDNLKISVLYPSYLHIQDWIAGGTYNLNESSLVLRIDFGQFSAILLADAEGDGLRELLRIPVHDLRATLVKIPHHGAWPPNGGDLQTLLGYVDAEVAVLCVGSTNPHKHVRPELYDALLTLRGSPATRLKAFYCTEVTRTCMHSAVERATMGRRGLARRLPCAGDIVITAEENGDWEFKNSSAHDVAVGRVPYAACRGRAEL